MLKKIVIMASLYSLANAMQLVPLKRQHEISSTQAERNLVRSYVSQEMSWLAQLYTASGFSGCMSRECFMVNALSKIKEAITNEDNRLHCLKMGAALGGMPVEGQPDKYACFQLNCLISGLPLLGTFLYKVIAPLVVVITVEYPREVSIFPVQNSCDRMYKYLGKKWGMDWAHECIMTSLDSNGPCNATELKDDTSYCCFQRVDPICNKVIVDYMTETYPVLQAHAKAEYIRLEDQAITARSMPFYITASGVITLNLLFQLARYKYRRIMKERAANMPKVEEVNA